MIRFAILFLGICSGGTELAPPGFSHIVAPSTVAYPRNTEGSILQLKGGELLLAWSRFFGGTNDGDGAEIAGMISPESSSLRRNPRTAASASEYSGGSHSSCRKIWLD